VCVHPEKNALPASLCKAPVHEFKVFATIRSSGAHPTVRTSGRGAGTVTHCRGERKRGEGRPSKEREREREGERVHGTGMGNNLCSELGIQPARPVGRDTFHALWAAYESTTGKMSVERARRFLADFADAAGVAYSPELADALLSKVCALQAGGLLTYTDFRELFGFAAEESEISLTMSLMTSVDGVGSAFEHAMTTSEQWGRTWPLIHAGLCAFFDRVPPTAQSFMQLYSLCHDFCSAPLRNDIRALYKELNNFLECRVLEVRSRAPPHDDARLLTFYLDEWGTYESACRRTQRALKDLDKYKGPGLPFARSTILECCWDQWTGVLMEPLRDRFLAALRSVVVACSTPDVTPDDRLRQYALVSGCLRSFFVMGADPQAHIKDIDIAPFLPLAAADVHTPSPASGQGASSTCT